jgi:hypothetical protein
MDFPAPDYPPSFHEGERNLIGRGVRNAATMASACIMVAMTPT